MSIKKLSIGSDVCVSRRKWLFVLQKRDKHNHKVHMDRMKLQFSQILNGLYDWNGEMTQNIGSSQFRDRWTRIDKMNDTPDFYLGHKMSVKRQTNLEFRSKNLHQSINGKLF